MSDLLNIEKLKLEKLFGMSSGYVLDFVDRTFHDFIAGSINIDIWESKYNWGSGSKANRLRAVWGLEQNYSVGKLTTELLEYYKTSKEINGHHIEPSEQPLYDECFKIAERLKQNSPLESLELILQNYDYKDFMVLSKSIRESIQKNEPENALDRLHTFLIKYLRKLCDKYSISYNINTPLHTLFGGYVKYLTDNKIIESQMTVRILKSSISVIESFNDVRNNKSYAHDNIILNYEESLLILNDISNIMGFIEAIERKPDRPKEAEENGNEDLPF